MLFLRRGGRRRWVGCWGGDGGLEGMRGGIGGVLFLLVCWWMFGWRCCFVRRVYGCFPGQFLPFPQLFSMLSSKISQRAVRREVLLSRGTEVRGYVRSLPRPQVDLPREHVENSCTSHRSGLVGQVGKDQRARFASATVINPCPRTFLP